MFPRMFPLSAGTPVALRSAAGRLAGWLRGEGSHVAPDDVAHTRRHAARPAGSARRGRMLME
ncbi:hypothetical protein [Streptomyces sp. CRN 30]|uniref:hypothetical protein n=1 Tax=Streptomyces sp. CRN 30 TaxID=3075613 RepID=UPI002A80DB5B|nr:hypothetical protein [Streptomyces sp. CRN 30]